MGGFQPLETMPDMTKFLFAGLEQARKDREKREKSKAMKDLFSSVATLFKDEIPSWKPGADLTPPTESPAAGIPQGAPSSAAPVPVTPSAGAPGGVPPVVGMPSLSPEQVAKAKEAFSKMSPEDQAKAMAVGKAAMGVPSAPGPSPAPGTLNFQPPPMAGPISPVEPVPVLKPDLRSRLLNAIAINSGDYTPEAVRMIHDLFSISPFKEDADGRNVYSHAPGSIVTDKYGRKLFQVPEKKDEAGIKKAEISAEAGIKKAEIGAEAGIKKAEISAEGRVKAADVAGRWRFNTEAERAKVARDVANLRITSGDRINSPAKLYTYLSQKYIDGTLQPAEKDILNHLEPVIIKMGGLQALLDMQSGTTSNPPPWGGKGPAEAPDQEVQKEVGWWGSLFGGSPDAATSTVPKKPHGKAASNEGAGFMVGTQKLTAPLGYSNADIQMTMDSMKRKLKEGYSKEQLIEHLKKKGWIVGK